MKRFIIGAVAAMALSACGGGQSAECKKYLTCTEKATPGSAASLESSYGASGSCWSNTSTADACTTACKNALTSLKTGFPNVSECQ